MTTMTMIVIITDMTVVVVVRGGIGYIKLQEFSSIAKQKIQEALNDLKAQGTTTTTTTTTAAAAAPW